LYSSDSTMFPEDKVWESLIEQGKAEDFYWWEDNQKRRFRFLED
jgi:hypothetical protein